MSRSRLLFAVILSSLLGLLLLLRERVEVSTLPAAQAISAAEPPVRFVSPGPEPSTANTPHLLRAIAENEKPNSVSSEAAIKHHAYCQIKNANLGLPLDGQLKMFAFAYEDADSELGFIAYVASSRCPGNGFSKIQMDSFGRVKSLLDCRTINRDEIALQSGIQSNIVDARSKSHARNFAISGDGFFVTSCDEGLVLQRFGNFHFQSGKLLRGKCEVLDQFGEPIDEDLTSLDRQGCAPSGICLAISRLPDSLGKIIDRTSVAIEDTDLQLLTDGRIFSDSLEDFSDPQNGPFGPNWEKLPFYLPPANCDE